MFKLTLLIFFEAGRSLLNVNGIYGIIRGCNINDGNIFLNVKPKVDLLDTPLYLAIPKSMILNCKFDGCIIILSQCKS